MLVEELIEKAFCDGYEYAQKLFFLSANGNPFTGEDIRKTKQDIRLRVDPSLKSTKTAYGSTAADIDVLKAIDETFRKLKRKGVMGEHLDNALNKTIEDTVDKSAKEMQRRFKADSKRKLLQKTKMNKLKNLFKRFR